MYKIRAVKCLLVSIFAWITVFGFVVTDVASALPEQLQSTTSLYLAEVPSPSGKDWMMQLETEILPQIEQIFNPEQREQFQANMADGMSFRKAFKSLTLTPEQKTQIKTVLQSVTKKDALASLTPEQKKQLFIKKKEMFMPTAEEVTEKIEASLKDKGVELPAGVKEKIGTGLKMKDSFMPTSKAITEKIEAGMNALKNTMEE
ncbi:hypothetical protein ACQ4M4_24395 [Leptolyngbya sp. AN02str]|uniref:hypothetical protein n=1 Tax=Leptolyngbya sp. AN02str TaxID=3423363 RepID=UPI003D319553